jgi:hypothetical protein
MLSPKGLVSRRKGRNTKDGKEDAYHFPFIHFPFLILLLSFAPLRLDTNPLGESIRGRLGRVYDAAQIARFRRDV